MARAPLMMRGGRSCRCHFCSAPTAVAAWWHGWHARAT